MTLCRVWCGFTKTWLYDAVRQVLGSDLDADTSYTYDAVGRLLTELKPSGITLRYHTM